MNRLISFSFASAAAAFSHNKAEQLPLARDACPSSSLINSECSSLPFDLSPDTAFLSYPKNASQSLQHSYQHAQQTPDFPWTFWPECYSNENTKAPFCVFSDQKFANGRGIFIVTTSEEAHKLLEKPAFAKPEVLERVNQHDNPPFEVREMPGKGRGLIATKTLHRGDQIFASTPLLITDPDAYDLAEDERLKLAHRGVDTLPAASQIEFWKLLDHFKGDPVDDRINTNAFEIEINGKMQHVVLPEIAMMNHDCRPNAAYFFDEETLSHYVHATQTTYPGQEITITYINNERVREKRMKNLKQNWGFDCSCSSCSAHPRFVEESDARIQQIDALAELLADWTADSTATPEMAETLIALYQQERLYASLGTAYRLAAEVYASFGDKWNAIKYARMSTELEMLDKGFGDTDVKAMQNMAQNPELSWAWKKRVGMRRLEGGCGHLH